MFGWIGDILNKLKVTALVKFAAPYLKTLAPWIIAGLTAIGVDPELSKEFAENTIAVATVAVGFLVDLLLTKIRVSKQ